MSSSGRKKNRVPEGSDIARLQADWATRQANILDNPNKIEASMRIHRRILDGGLDRVSGFLGRKEQMKNWLSEDVDWGVVIGMIWAPLFRQDGPSGFGYYPHWVTASARYRGLQELVLPGFDLADLETNWTHVEVLRHSGEGFDLVVSGKLLYEDVFTLVDSWTPIDVEPMEIVQS